MTISAHSLTNYQVEINTGTHTLISDEPIGIGDDAGPSPFELLLGSLGSCIVITVEMYARRKNWPLERVDIELGIRSEEYLDSEGVKKRRSTIDTHLQFHGPLSIDQVKRLEEISTRCPVHRALTGEITITHEYSNPVTE